MNKGRIFTFLILLLLFLAPSIWGGGRKEDTMPQAQMLVQEKKYSEAINILADIVKNQPERLDEVEKLMSQIRSARAQYNNNYSELIQILKKETLTDSDVTEAYNLITEMEKLDAAPDKAITGSFEKARRTIVFRYNDTRFREIMDEALVLIDRGQYWDAVSLYLQAIGLHGEIFREDYPEEVITEVEAVIAEVNNDFKKIIAGKDDFIIKRDNSYLISDKDYYEGISDEYAPLLSLISDMAVIRDKAVKEADYFDSKKNEIIREGEYDIPFLSTISRTITGRASSEREEGLLYAVDSIWRSAVDQNLAILDEKRSEYYEKGLENFDSGSYFSASEEFRKSSGVSGVRKELLSFWGYSVSPDMLSSLSKRDKNKIAKYVPEYIQAEKQGKAAFDYAVLSEIMSEADRIDKSYKSVESSDVLMEYREEIVRNRSVIDINRDVWNEIFNSSKSMSGGSLDLDKTVNLSSDMNTLFAKYSDYLSSLEIDLIKGRFELVYNPLKVKLENEAVLIDEAAALVEGIEETVGEGENTYSGIVKYPAVARPALLSSRDKLEQYESDYDVLNSNLSGEDNILKDSPGIQETLELISSDKTIISDLNNKIGMYLIESDELLTQAEIHRTQGYKRLEEARVRLRQNRFTEARERLQEARESFRISLGFSEDPELRAFSDREILALSEDIIRLQTALVIETVRKNLNKARDLYVREQFGDAESLLINSQSMWKTVNTTENAEVQYWLNLVQTALSVRSGRVIAETDPLYSEMSQVINLARNDYIKARSLASEGKNEQAIGFLQSAEEKLLYVSIPFPMNQEASILSLEIQRIKDPDNFDQLFREKYNLAKERININPTESYILLKDLAEINPDYPGIKKAIYDTEIKLGMRTPPPDPAKIREAEDLYNKAYAIVSSNVKSSYPTALEYLNQAFVLNPDNSNVTYLKDRVQTEMGGSTTVVLSSYAQEQYRLAEQEFINGNYYASLAIVNKLLQDKRNRNYSPLLELKRRIDSKI